jgi:predicted polyphosphate/ATP-dependent NAD kinase
VTASLGLIINPTAGMGGAVGLHGTDGAVRLEEARCRQAKPVTPARATRALRRVDVAMVSIVTAPGPMGADVLAACGLQGEVIVLELASPTTGTDTEAAARALVDAGCDLIIFAGGDGTAHDVVRGARDVPVIGIPSGVKMRSGVFAASPEIAGDVVNDFLRSDRRVVTTADLLDVNERDEPERLLGVATVPCSGDRRIAGSKVSTIIGSRAEFDALCHAVAQELANDTLYLFGPGSTTGAVLGELGLVATALGFDAVMNGELVGSDLSEDEILDLMDRHKTIKLILSVIGGQGFLLGRGNQQLSATVLRRLGRENLMIISSALKLFALDPAILWIDVDGGSADVFAGYHRVRVAPRKSVLMRVAVPI